MIRRSWPRCVLPLLVVMASFVAVTRFDHALAAYRYAYVVDSASYVDMARSWRAVGQPLVTPWDVDQGPDAIPQVLFPPGFSALIAILTPLAGDALHAALWPGRWAAMLLPLMLVLLFRGLVSDWGLVWVAAVTVLTPGVREWHYVAYSDVPTLWMSVCALGCLARGFGWVGAATRWYGLWLCLAGALAGLAYSFRNAGLAVMLASGVMLMSVAWQDRRLRWAGAWWLLGALPWMLALWIYNLRTFGHLQPYVMPPSTRPWMSNLGDYARSQLADLGIPTGGWSPLYALVGCLCLLGLFVYRWRQLETQPKRQGVLALLAVFIVMGAAMLVVSRSRYEWGGLIDARYTLQYAWAVALGIAVSVADIKRPLLRWWVRGLATALVVMLVWSAVQEVSRWRGWGAQTWLVLSKDPTVRMAVQAMPPGTLMASNAAALLRLEANRPVREIEVGGQDADFANALAQAAVLAGSRPIVFFLVCDEFAGQLSVCGGASQAVAEAPICRPIRVTQPAVWVCVPVRRPVDDHERGIDHGHV